MRSQLNGLICGTAIEETIASLAMVMLSSSTSPAHYPYLVKRFRRVTFWRQRKQSISKKPQMQKFAQHQVFLLWTLNHESITIYVQNVHRQPGHKQRRWRHWLMAATLTTIEWSTILQAINQSTKWRMQALKCLCIRILNVNTTFNSNQSRLSTLIDLRFNSSFN